MGDGFPPLAGGLDQLVGHDVLRIHVRHAHPRLALFARVDMGGNSAEGVDNDGHVSVASGEDARW